MEIFLVYSANKSLLSKAIQCYTKEAYNHVSLALDKELINTYSFGRKKMSNPLIGGFVKEDFWDPFFFTSECAIYSLDVSPEEYEKITSLLNYFEKNKALYKYNFIGLLALSLEYNLEREHAYFCSEFIATILTESNVGVFEKDNQFIKPQDLLSLNRLEKVYEGQIIDYLTSSKLSQPLEMSMA
ncbi:hypothetical protein [Vagococcus fluvialis]|uniref:hypothetical protein n=1 Tax=Vagococcus fluvialis TaxID=2738 RepID=UPI003D1385E0